MHEIHGLADVLKGTMSSNDSTQNVRVIDTGCRVRLAMSSSSYPAEMTPKEARFIAAALIASAERAEAAGATDAAPG